MRTVWGYDVEGTIEPIISAEDFTELTGIDNPRAEAAVAAASQAIRNYCGWHISPSLNCTAYPVGGGPVAKLPAGYVSSITSISENGAALDSGVYEWRSDGLIRRTDCKKWADSWDGITAVYAAGYSADAIPDLVEAVCSVASGVLSVSPGVTNESADGVSISYSQSASSIAAALTSQQKCALEPYKLVSSHAA